MRSPGPAFPSYFRMLEGYIRNEYESGLTIVRKGGKLIELGNRRSKGF
jgi:hypothetical protein